MLSDQDLMQRIIDQDSAAFESLFAQYEAMIHRHIARTVRNPQAAEDLVQEVFLRVWTRAEQWQGRGSLKSWLYQIATNLSLNHIRAVKRRPQQSLEGPVLQSQEADFQPAPHWLIDPRSRYPDEMLEQAEDYAQLWRLIDSLPQEKREVFRLVHQAQLPIREVADRLSVPEGTIKSRLYYGLKSLARKWQDFEWD